MEILEFIKENGTVGCCGCCHQNHDISDELMQAYQLGMSEDMAMLARENKAMAEKLEKLGYSQSQISDICNGAI